MSTGSTVVEIFEGVEKIVTVEGNGLSELAAAFSAISNAGAVNLVVQTSASLAGLAANVFPISSIPAVLLSEVGVATGIKVLNEDRETAKMDAAMHGGIPPPHDVLTIYSDVVSVAGDLSTCVSAILNLIPITKPAAAALSLVSSLFDVASITLLVGDPITASNIKTGLSNKISKLEAALSNYGATISSAFPSLGGSMVTALSGALAAVASTINSDPADLLSNAAAAASALTSANTALLNLFNSTGNSVPSTTETDNGGAVTTTVTGSSFTGTSSLNFDPEDDATYGSYSLSLGSGTTTTATDMLAPNGAATLDLSAQSGSTLASQITEADPSGTISGQQTTFDGTAIITQPSETADITTAADGSLSVEVLPLDSGDYIGIEPGSDDSDQIVIGRGTDSPQPVIDFAPGGLNGDTIDITNSGGSFDVITDIGAGGTSIIGSDDSVAGVTQDIQFGDPDDTLELDNPSGFTGTISNFLVGDTLDLQGVETATTTAATLSADNILTVQASDGSTISLQLDPSQSFDNVTFITQPDDEGGTEVTEFVAAALSGTQIATVDAPIEFDGTTTTYSASVSLTPIDIQLQALRTDDPLPPLIPITATFLGGHLDPNDPDAPVGISQLYPNPSIFYMEIGAVVGLSSTSATGEIALNTSALSPGAAGDYSDESLPLEVDYDGSSTTVDLTIGVKIYATAVPEFFIGGVQTFGLDFGIVHLGQTASMDVGISNAATGDLTDALSSSPGTLGQFTAENGIDDIPAGGEGTVTVSVTGEIAGPTLILDSTPLFGLVSHDSDLPDDGIGPSVNIPNLSATVYYYANPIFTNSIIGAPVGTLTQDGNNWTLDLGTITLGFYGDDAQIGIENATPSFEYSDTLTGSDDVSGSSDGGFIQALSDLSGMSAPGGGNFMALGVIEPYGGVLGTHSETITFFPISSNSSGFSEALPDQTLTITDDVSLPDISGAELGLEGDTITATIDAGEDVSLDSLFAGEGLDTLIIDGPGTAEIDGPALVADLEVSPGGTLVLDGATITTDPVTVEAGGNLSGFGTITGDETANGIISANGGILDLTGNVDGNGTLTFDSGAALQLEGTVAATESLIFNGPDEALVLGSTAEVVSVIAGLGAGDIFALESQPVTSAIYDGGEHTLDITGGDGTAYTFNISGNYQQSDFAIVAGAVDVTCFLAGTRIATRAGYAPIDELAIGDLVQAKFAGETPVRWIGQRYIDCRHHSKPENVWPVHIRAGAFMEGIPSHDLWLSPDHAIFVDDVLVPARLLINGATIVQEQMAEVTYFHVELASHDLLLAEGLPTESYLDTGNRAMFANAGIAMILHPDFATVNAGLKCWERDACAPLAVGSGQVEPIWRKLAARADLLGYPPFDPDITTDPRLRIQACGREIVPLPAGDGWWTFALPRGIDVVSLLSRTGSPSDIRPWIEDRRQLGVYVGRMRVHCGTDVTEIPVDHPALRAGWWDVEHAGISLRRWTRGDAQVPVPPDAAILEVQLAGVAEYPIEALPRPKAQSYRRMAI